MGNNVTLIPKQPARHSLLTNVENVVYMPLASRYSHGIVRVGDGLNITTDGLLSVDVNSEWYATIRGDVDQLKVSVQDLKTDFDTALMDVSDINEKLSDIENGTKLISVYQTKQDSGLVTINKTVVGGINEIKNQITLNINNIDSVKNELTGVKRDYATLKYVDDLYANISMGGNKSYVFETREQFISWLDGVYEREDSFKPELLNIGDIVLIEEMGVPDYWVKSKSSPMTINDFREYEAKIEIPEIRFDNISINKNQSGEIQSVALKNALKNIESEVSYSDFTGVIRLTKDQYNELVSYGSIIVDGEIINFDNGTLYVTPDSDFEDLQTQLDSLGGVVDMKADRAVVDQNTVDIVSLQTTLNELMPKVMKSLVTPMNAPTTTELVAVDDGNSQTMIEIGDGLKIENGKLMNDNLSYPEIVEDGVVRTGAGDRVIETYISSDGLTWYRKYASGWKECGLNKQKGTASGFVARTLTLPISFSNANYTAIATFETTSDGNLTDVSQQGIYSKTSTSISVYVNDTDIYKNIYCCGY